MKLQEQKNLVNLSKYSELSDRYVQVPVSEDYVFAEKGEIIGQYNDINAVLNNEQTIYESRIGIILIEPGRFDIFGQSRFFNIFPVNVLQGKVHFSISHIFEDEVAERFTFTVKE
ncbi:hypothetical protein JQC67_01815 [Aurantibacter crassamenti]|uniref:hypothetical protein n=1 Tax=Aurantibacter crassamenti TaxID=1837375 RepID=UPI001939ACA3|nr:hypothetical protein [Aurantibacter crassamenti]MBM1104863.1 hypothetical protein [Aurantibacter crassamenti]